MLLVGGFAFSLPFTDPILIFSLILLIILVAPLILNKLKIPHLIGLIIAGALIGPNGLNLILRDSSFELFGTVGLLYIMFLAGLEMDVNDFKKNSSKSFIFGMYTFLIPMLLGTLVGYFILHFSIQSSILLASMLASHTLITYPIISKLGLAKNQAVNIAVGGTIITDTLALLVLAVIAGMSAGEITSNFWIRLILSFIVFAAIVNGIIPIIARWFFKHVDDNISQYIFVLGVVFLAAFLAVSAGVEGIIGAFLAGLALNRLIPQTSPLMNRIEFVGNALFIPFFLIGVGMLINFESFFRDKETLIVALAITLTALIAKFSAAYFTQKTFGYTTDQRRLIFGLSNSQAAATLAAVLVGHRIGLLNDAVLNGSILMILITCTVSSFVTLKGAQNIAKNEFSEEEPTTNDTERILIPINKPEMVARLINLSVILKNPKIDNNLFALNILSNKEQDNTEQEKKARKILEIASETAAATDNSINELLRYDIDIANAIKSVVREHKITDMILGLHEKKYISDSILGALTEIVLSKCNTTTFIYKAHQPLETIKRHLVIIPPNADKEVGFSLWLNKIWNMGKNTKTKLIIYASNETISLIQKIQEKFPIEVEYTTFDDWNDFLILARDIKADDSMNIIMSRINKPSYNPVMNDIPSYLNKYFKDNNFILIYPIQALENNSISANRFNPTLDYEGLSDFGSKMKSILKK